MTRSQWALLTTGPTSVGESFRRVFLAAIQSAQSRVMMTTPYFVPDEPTLVSLNKLGTHSQGPEPEASSSASASPAPTSAPTESPTP